ARHPGHAERRREGGRDDRQRPVDVAASGLEAPTHPQRGGTRPLPGRRTSPVVPPGARPPSAAAAVAGQVRAGAERAAPPAGRLPQRATAKRSATVMPNRHGTAGHEYPTDLEIVTTRQFDAPIQLVFDVLTKPEHVRNWFAAFEDKVTECSIDLRVGGDYRIV